MSSHAEFAELAEVLATEVFPDVDLALRAGRHIDRDDEQWYEFLCAGQEHLETFYRRYGCELIHPPDGYFYLLPSGDKLPRRHLSSGDMLVGQALALLYLDPATVEHGGSVHRDQVLAQLDGVVGTDALIRAFHPQRRRYDERVAQQAVRKKVGESIRRLAALGFLRLAGEEHLQLGTALLRFAEPARASSEPAAALQRLIARGEVALIEDRASEGSGGASGEVDAGSGEVDAGSGEVDAE